ncbi:MAG: hypothetical protein LQ349_000066 [Xanthoria aureola]|nr:MAG: hypothetical protein LQ349_000066 [Xanthoria aureola]
MLGCRPKLSHGVGPHEAVPGSRRTCKPHYNKGIRELVSMGLSLPVLSLSQNADYLISFASLNSAITSTSPLRGTDTVCPSQWRNPNDVLTILMIIGGDIVQKALAQLSGAVVTVSAMLWILFVINVAGLTHNTWYLLGVGFLGMVQNVSTAAIPRRPEAVGMPLELVARISDHKVMKTLMETERRFPSVGAALVKTFFSGELFDDEQRFWTARSKKPRNDTKRVEPVDQPYEGTSQPVIQSNRHGPLPYSPPSSKLPMDPSNSQIPCLPSWRLTT